MIDLADVGDRVPGSSGKRETNKWKRNSGVACVICSFCARSLVILAKRERVPGESLESI